jgi:type IV secretion system protein VirD4
MQKITQIEFLRKENGLSQEKLAEQLNISRQTISEWERGITYPSVEKLIQLGDIFNVSLDYLIRGQEFKSNKDNNKDVINNFKYSSLGNTDSLLFGKDGKYYVSTKDNEEIGSTLTIGCAGSGKTRCVLLNNIEQTIKRNESLVITDPKGEIFYQMADKLILEGYNIKVLNFYDDKLSMSWNPLLDFSDNIFYFEKKIELLYKSLFCQNEKNKYLSELCYNLFRLLTIVVLLDKEINKEDKTLYKVYRLLLDSNKNELYNMFLNIPCEDGSIEELCKIILNSKNYDEIKRNLFYEMNQVLKYESIKNVTEKNDFNIKDIYNHKTALFIIPNIFDEKFTKFNELFLDMLIYNLLEDEYEIKYGLSLFLDEYGNTCRNMKNFRYLLRDLRGLNIKINIFLQNLNQIKPQIRDMERIYDLFDNIIICGSKNFSDIELFSQKLNLEENEILKMSNNNLIVHRKKDVIILKKHFFDKDYKKISLKEYFSKL